MSTSELCHNLYSNRVWSKRAAEDSNRMDLSLYWGDLHVVVIPRTQNEQNQVYTYRECALVYNDAYIYTVRGVKL